MANINFNSKPGEYQYEETRYGKVAYGVVQNGAQSNRNPQAQREAGHDERLEHDQGGHLIPHSQGGRNDETNLVAQNANVNQIDVRAIERQNSELASNPNNKVYVHVNAYTQPGYERPDAFMITSAVKDETTGKVDIQHSSFTNASHEEQEQWSALADQYSDVDPRQDEGLSAEDRALADQYADYEVDESLGDSYTWSAASDETDESESDDYSMDYGMSM